MPPKRPDAPPPWWLEPLAWRLAETMEIEQSDGRPKDADTLARFSLLHHVEIGKFMRLLTARGAPAPLAVADTLRPPQVGPIEVQILTPLDRLPTEKRRQINAAAHLIETALFAASKPTRIERGGPHDLNDPGDVVGVERVRVRTDKGIRDDREAHAKKVHAKGVAGKILGATIELYGAPRIKIARTLARLVTGEKTLTVEEVKALCP